jgi:hypothetical protein
MRCVALLDWDVPALIRTRKDGLGVVVMVHNVPTIRC